MPTEAWAMVEEGHPQNTLKELLSALDVQREDVLDWHEDTGEDTHTRERLISDIMTPPDHTHNWQDLSLSTAQKNDYIKTIKNVQRLDCKTPQEEAELIAILLRQTCEDSNKTAALITPCLLYTSPSPRDQRGSRMPSSA